MKRNTRRQFLFLILVSGLILKKIGLGLSVLLTFSAILLFSIEMIRSARSKNHHKLVQTSLYIVFCIFFFIAFALLQYWIPNIQFGFEIWIGWILYSIIFFLKAKFGKTQIVLWCIISFLLTSSAFMTPRNYHNFYRASYYEDYMRRHYTEVEMGIADMYIDKYKEPQKEIAHDLYIKAKEAQKIKDNDLALELYNAAIDKFPDDEQMYYDRGYFKLSRLELSSDVALGAVKDFDRAIKLNPTFSQAYLSRALALSYLGKHLRACYDYTLAKNLNPKLNVEEGLKKNCSRINKN